MIPVNEPLFCGNESVYLKECIDSGWVSSEGPFVNKFENQYAEFIGVDYGVAVSSGTAALECALYAIGVGKGDEVIIPSFTIISCAIACIRVGAKPVLVDSNSDNWNIDVDQIETKINKKTKAIMAVHIYGHSVYMDKLIELKEKYGLLIIEDIAESQGSEYFSKKEDKWWRCGSIGDVAAVSFYANKTVTTGEGGMVLSGSSDYTERAKSYRNLCFDTKQRFLHNDIGNNYRMTNLQAALGLAQLEQVDNFLKIKQEIGKAYKKELANINWLRFMHSKEWSKSAYWMYCILINKEESFNAQDLSKYLAEHKIGHRPFFKGLHQQDCLREHVDTVKCPNADEAFEFGLYLPSGMTMDESKVKIVCNILREYKS
ncbi:MAG: aminotransferase DegT [Planctomycetota bacterium]|nr:MAG: aminotransferase DegT [Planctomycetota bacterium]